MSLIKEKIRENWILKIIAILLAWVLWLFLQGDSGTIRTVTAPVDVGMPTGMVISSGLPSDVQVIIRGTSQDLTCYIDLEDAEEGEINITLNEENIRFSKGLGTEVIQVDPSHIALMLEKNIRKTVPITVPSQGNVAEGFQIYERIPDPNRVTIEGPRSQIEPIEEIPTQIIALNGQNQSVNFRVRLNISEGSIRSSVSDSIWVEIKIGPKRNLYVVKDVPVLSEDAPYLSSPKKIDIQIMAPEVLREALIPDNFELTIEDQDLEDATFPIKVEPAIWYPPDWVEMVELRGTIPSEVTISEKEESASKQ